MRQNPPDRIGTVSENDDYPLTGQNRMMHCPVDEGMRAKLLQELVGAHAAGETCRRDDALN